MTKEKTIEQKAIDATLKSIKRTWMNIYDFDPSLSELSDEELSSKYRSYPRTLNNLNEDEKEKLAQLYMEIHYRHELKNKQAHKKYQINILYMKSKEYGTMENLFLNRKIMFKQ